MIYRTLVLSLIIVAAATLKLGSDDNKCLWGPSYWCDSVANAKMCDTEEHCRDKVWMGMPPLAKLTKPIPEDKRQSKPLPKKSANCAICEMIGKKVVTYLRNNATEDEIIANLESICTYLPDDDQAICEHYAETYGKEMYDFLVDNQNVHAFCQLMGLCSQEFLDILKRGNTVSVALSQNYRNIECDTCTSLVDLVQREGKVNEDAIEALLDEVCSIIPLDPDECQQIVNSVFESFFDYFQGLEPKEACQLIGLCVSYKNMIGITPVKLGQPGQRVEGVPVRPLGQDTECEEGPAFWCASKENAKKCQVEDYDCNSSPIIF